MVCVDMLGGALENRSKYNFSSCGFRPRLLMRFQRHVSKKNNRRSAIPPKLPRPYRCRLRNFCNCSLVSTGVFAAGRAAAGADAGTA